MISEYVEFLKVRNTFRLDCKLKHVTQLSFNGKTIKVKVKKNQDSNIRLYKNDRFPHGDYACWCIHSSNECILLMLPSTEKLVNEFNTTVGTHRFINDEHVLYMFNHYKKFECGYFENIVLEREAKIKKAYDEDPYNICIQNAEEVGYEIISEGVWEDITEDTVRSTSFNYKDCYRFIVIKTTNNRMITVVLDKLQNYKGDYIPFLPNLRAFEARNNEWRLGIKPKFYVIVDNKKYYFNK